MMYLALIFYGVLIALGTAMLVRLYPPRDPKWYPPPKTDPPPVPSALCDDTTVKSVAIPSAPPGEWDDTADPIHYMIAQCAAAWNPTFRDEETNLRYRVEFADKLRERCGRECLAIARYLRMQHHARAPRASRKPSLPWE